MKIILGKKTGMEDAENMGIVRKEEELVVSPGCRHTSDLWNVIVGLCL